MAVGSGHGEEGSSAQPPPVLDSDAANIVKRGSSATTRETPGDPVLRCGLSWVTPKRVPVCGVTHNTHPPEQIPSACTGDTSSQQNTPPQPHYLGPRAPMVHTHPGRGLWPAAGAAGAAAGAWCWCRARSAGAGRGPNALSPPQDPPAASNHPHSCAAAAPRQTGRARFPAEHYATAGCLLGGVLSAVTLVARVGPKVPFPEGDPWDG